MNSYQILDSGIRYITEGVNDPVIFHIYFNILKPKKEIMEYVNMYDN